MSGQHAIGLCQLLLVERPRGNGAGRRRAPGERGGALEVEAVQLEAAVVTHEAFLAGHDGLCAMRRGTTPHWC